MKKRGNRLGFLFFQTVLRTGGLRAAYGFLYPVCLHYLLFDRAAVRAASATVRHLFPEAGPLRRMKQVYRLFVSQGACLIDRYAHARGGLEFEIRQRGLERLDEATRADGRGAILLTAHAGNWQLAMTALQQLGRTVHLLMRPEENAAALEALQIQREGTAVKILSVDTAFGGMVEVMQALERGDVVSIMGDRSYGGRTVEVDFIGEPAHFPCSAYSIAAAAGCPVAVLLSAKTGLRRYDLELCDLFYPQRREGSESGPGPGQSAQRFASILEGWLRRFPAQCFLFYDVWNGSADREKRLENGENRVP